MASKRITLKKIALKKRMFCPAESRLISKENHANQLFVEAQFELVK
jgi:hypothetical protein